MKASVIITSDHAGYALKEYLKKTLENQINFDDLGPFTEDSVDYPDYAHQAAAKMKETGSLAIVICGSGNGINMTMNKHAHVRSALCWTKEIAEMARLHNNANCIALPARYIAQEVALDIVETFLHTEFEGGRHLRRVEKIPC